MKAVLGRLEFKKKTVTEKCDTHSTSQVKRNPRCANTSGENINLSKDSRHIYINVKQTVDSFGVYSVILWLYRE